MAHLAREGEVEQICFLQCIAESCLISKNLENITKLPADIQKKWLEFYLEKLKLLKNRSVYELVNFSKRQRVIKNCWIFNIKFDSYYRSWLVVKGFSQIKRINFDKLFSPIVHYKMAHLFLVVTILEDWNIYSIDVKTTYLYSNLNKKIYMK